MCGVMGVSILKGASNYTDLVNRVLEESQIRGKHATGIAWNKNGELHCYIQALPVKEFLELEEFSLEDCISDDGSLKLIGHTRYCTSDILDNQPIGNPEKGFIVHNGIITQSDHSEWKSKYGIETLSKNDSELLYHTWINNKDSIDPIFDKFGTEASYAAIKIDMDGDIVVLRNHLRPLWKYHKNYVTIYASTLSILLRSGLDQSYCEKVPLSNDFLEDMQVRHDGKF